MLSRSYKTTTTTHNKDCPRLALVRARQNAISRREFVCLTDGAGVGIDVTTGADVTVGHAFAETTTVEYGLVLQWVVDF
jgi:hypothetical protein